MSHHHLTRRHSHQLTGSEKGAILLVLISVPTAFLECLSLNREKGAMKEGRQLE
jgi:hypothetical protein